MMQAQYFYPQRPKLCARSLMGRFEREPRRWLAELKLNGDRCVVVVTKARELQLWNRHGEPLKYRPPKWMKDQLLDALPANTVLDGELMHARVRELKNCLALFDVIMYNGRLLITEPQRKRWSVLDSFIFPSWFAPPRDGGVVFILRRMPVRVAWERALLFPATWVEGIVVKDKTAPASVGLHRNPTAEGWFKIRRPKQGMYVM